MLFNKKNIKPSLIQENDESSVVEWLNYEDPETEGQLAIDVFQTDKKIIIKSTIAGVKPEDLKISLHHDLLTIKGIRSMKEEVNDEDYLFRECYWGSFSRSIILPIEVDSKRVEAELESGILTISLYKTNPSQIEVTVKD
jgi:HSP20 family protein